MSDSYMTISTVANDVNLRERMTAAATQQSHLGNAPGITDPAAWVSENRYVWAASPGWADKWDSSLIAHVGDPYYQPGRDAAVITDEDILATVQALGT